MNKLFLLLPFLFLAGCIGTGTGVAAQQGDTIKVDYVGSLENGSVFDTSIETEAQKAGLPQRPSYAPIEFKIGSGALIKGFDDAVRGMRVGEEKTIRIPPNEAYGDVDQALITEVPRENIQGAEVFVGGVIRVSNIQEAVEQMLS